MTRALRRKLLETGAGASAGFRWRGNEITRLEGFTDAVFAFAVTLLVVSLEVPHTFSELLTTMRGFIAFSLCFAMLVWIWHEHYVFFRRYGFQDPVTVVLNAVLIFVVLFYVYPLKFLFTLVIANAMGAEASPIGETDVRTLFLIYDSGVIAVFLVLSLMYFLALRRRAALALNDLETFDTRSSLVQHLLAAGVGAVSIVLALTLPARLIGFAGFSYFLFGPVLGLHGFARGARRRRLEERLRAVTAPPA